MVAGPALNLRGKWNPPFRNAQTTLVSCPRNQIQLTLVPAKSLKRDPVRRSCLAPGKHEEMAHPKARREFAKILLAESLKSAQGGRSGFLARTSAFGSETHRPADMTETSKRRHFPDSQRHENAAVHPPPMK